MPNEKKDGMKKKLFSNLEIIFLTEMGFFSSLKNLNIRFNPKRREKLIHQQFKPDKTEIKQEKKSFDLNLEISKKIDQIIEKNENIIEEPEFFTITEKPTFQNEKKLIEIRKPRMKNPDMPSFKTDFEGEIDFNQKPKRDVLFNVQIPQTTQSEIDESNDLENITFTKIPEQDHNKKHSFFLHKKNQDSVKVLTSLDRIKVRPTEEKAKKSSIEQQSKQNSYRKNEVNQTKKELEMTITELERKKKEIQEMEQLAKLKEEELKEKQKERKKKEKQKALELKMKERLEKIKKHQEKKLEKQRKLEQLKQERLNKLEAEKAEREKQKMLLKLKKQQEIEAKKIEKEKLLKKLEAEKAEKEKQRLEKIKQLEAEKAEKEKQRLEKIQQLEAEKQIKIVEKKTIKEEGIETPEQKPETLEPSLITESESAKIVDKIKEQEQTFDEEVSQVFKIIDSLLEKLPEKAIDEFVKSDDFEIYEKVVNKYKHKR